MGFPAPSEIINRLKDVFHDQIALEHIQPSAFYIKIDFSLIRPLAEYVVTQFQGRFVTCAALDYRPEKGKFTVIYVFALDSARTFMGIKYDLDPSAAVIDSLTPLIPGANWAERELKDMSGITPRDTRI